MNIWGLENVRSVVVLMISVWVSEFIRLSDIMMGQEICDVLLLKKNCCFIWNL